jgi:hypothetical protein
MNIPGAYDIDESLPAYDIEKLDPTSEASIRLFTKHMILFQSYASFWRDRRAVAKKCHDYERRDIFTPEQRKEYMNTLNKWPIEPQEMTQVINMVEGEVNNRVKGYTVTTEDETPPKQAAGPEVVSVVLKWLENNMKLAKKRIRVLRNGLIDGYPQWILFDKVHVAGNPTGRLVAEVPKWDDTLPYPWYKEPDGSDMSELMIVSQPSKAELLAEFPERKQAFDQFQSAIKADPGLLTQALSFQGEELTADMRRNVIYDVILQAQGDQQSGRYTTIKHLYSVMKKRRVYVSEAGDAQTLPEDWTREEKKQWENDHPEYDFIDDQQVPTLWVTTWSTCGFVWENREHWFQKLQEEHPYAKLPGACYIASDRDGIPTGKGEDMLPYILLIACSATEGLSQVRKGTGRTTFIEEGYVRNPKHLHKELSDEEGIVLLKKGAGQARAFHTETRTPNDTFLEVEDRYRNQLKEVHGGYDAAMGKGGERQSDRAKQTDIERALLGQTPYALNFQTFCYNVTQLLCDMFPYFLTERMMIEVDDEFGNSVDAIINEQEVNATPMGGEQPQVPQTGAPTPGQPETPGEPKDWEVNAKYILNDLSATAYRIVPIPGDDSPTSREQDMIRFSEIMEAVGNSFAKLLQYNPSLLGAFLVDFPNRYARETGQWILENAQQMQAQQQEQAQAQLQAKKYDRDQRTAVEMAKIKAPAINYKISPLDVQQAPLGYKIMMAFANGGSIPQDQLAAMQAGQPVQPAPEPQLVQ